jgi:hypothetical protein
MQLLIFIILRYQKGCRNSIQKQIGQSETDNSSIENLMQASTKEKASISYFLKQIENNTCQI